MPLLGRYGRLRAVSRSEGSPCQCAVGWGGEEPGDHGVVPSVTLATIARYSTLFPLHLGASVTEVARRFGVSRQTVHAWLRRYAGDGGFGNLADRSSRPRSCLHQMSAVVEARVLVLRDGHPSWGLDRIRWQLGQEGVVPVPGRSTGQYLETVITRR